ncbi:MAG: caspase family protein [Elusimicrobia bacterium]|nr:caspase family protein [Elusimicrobiota bacterium]
MILLLVPSLAAAWEDGDDQNGRILNRYTAPSVFFRRQRSRPVKPVNVYPPGMPVPAQPVQPPAPWQPPAKGAGPERPPVMVSFAETYEAVVKAYLKEAEARNEGDFLVKDEVTSHLYRLMLVRVPRDRIVYLSREEAFSCVTFKGAGGEKIDLDIYVRRSGVGGEWSVSKIYLHKIDDEERFVYGPNYQPMAPEAAAAATAAAEARTQVLQGRATAKPAPAPAVPKPEKPAKLSLQVSFREPSGNGLLDGEEKGELEVSVSNAGPGPAYAVRLTPFLQSKSQVSLPAYVEVGEVRAGRTSKVSVPLEAASAASGKVQVRIEAKEGNGFDAEPILVEFKARAFQAPKLSVSAVEVGPGRTVRAGEPMSLRVEVRNLGPGPAEAVTALLVTGSKDVFISGEPSAPLGGLGAGESKAAEFEFFVNKRYKEEGPLPLTVTLSEARGRYGLNAAPLNLVLGKAPPAMKVVAFQGKEAGREQEAEPAAALEDVDYPPKSKAALDPHAFAVIVGIEQYRDLPAVEFAGRDAEAMYAYLTRAMGFDSRNVTLLKDERATLTDMATFLGPWLEDRVTPESRVFVYFAGHGAPDPRTGEGYLIPHDGNPSYVATKALAVKDLYAGLAKLPAKDVTVVLDACFSGSGGRSVLAKGARPLVQAARAPDPGENMAVITASRGDQISTYFPEARHGMLTYFLLKGLRGGADRDSDRQVTTAELFGFLTPEVEREARRQHVEQTPTISPDLGRLGDKGTRVWVRLK